MSVAIGCLIAACHSGEQRDLLGVGGSVATDEGGVTDSSGDSGADAGGGSSGDSGADAADGSERDQGEIPDGGDAEAGPDAQGSRYCGDHHTDFDLNEECDDGNEQHSDGCEIDCQKTRIDQVALGQKFTCALSSAGGVKCWGIDTYGSLGRGTDGADIIDPLQVPPLDLGTTRRVTQITASYYHACALFEDGKARCWGQNQSGQLGNGNQSDYGDDPDEQLKDLEDLPVSNVKSITAGLFGTCAVIGNTGAERLHCWGGNQRGELGLGSKDLLTTPGGPAVLNAVPKMAIIGYRWVAATLATGDARCWGGYAFGVRGVGPTDYAMGDGVGNGAGVGTFPDDSAYNVQGIPGAVSMISGTNNTICALSAGNPYCWGRNDLGRTGYPVTTYGTEIWQTPRAVELGDVSLVQISTGDRHSCGIDGDGVVRCWGNSYDDGALGYPGYGVVGADRDPEVDYQIMSGLLTDAGLIDASLPLPLGAVDVGDFDGVPGLDPVAIIVAGPYRTCAIMETGTLRCWGDDASTGRLGYKASAVNIGLNESPAQAYQEQGYADVQVFGPVPTDAGN